MSRILVCCSLPVLLSSLALADTSLRLPVTGYVADSSMPVLRAVLGVPGALRFSDPLALPDGVTRVRVAPGRDFAWVERGDAPPGLLILSGGSADRLVPIENALPAADWAAFSPGSASLVLFSSSAGKLQVLTGLPGDPRVAWDLDVAAMPESPLAAAVSDDGNILLAASGNAVYLLPRGAGAQQIFSGHKIGALAMMPNGLDAVAAELEAGSVYLLQNLKSAPAVRTLVSDLGSAGAVYPASDGSTILLTMPAAQAVSIIDSDTGDVQPVAVDVAPAMLYPLSDRNVFLISSRPGEPGWIFFRTGRGGRALFIPAAPGPAETQQ